MRRVKKKNRLNCSVIVFSVYGWLRDQFCRTARREFSFFVPSRRTHSSYFLHETINNEYSEARSEITPGSVQSHFFYPTSRSFGELVCRTKNERPKVVHGNVCRVVARRMTKSLVPVDRWEKFVQASNFID